jgi:two-component system, NarL family, sensor histidine kinase DesK
MTQTLGSQGAAQRDEGSAGHLEWVSRFQGPWFALIWAPVLLVGPMIDAARVGRTVQVLFLLLLATSFAAVVSLPFLVAGFRVRRRWVVEVAVAGLMAEGTIYLFNWRGEQEFIFPLLSIATATGIRPRWALSIISALTISGALTAGFDQESVSAAMYLGFSTFFAGVAVYLVQYLIRLVVELDLTRDELAVAAVAQERLRFSRDLHDLLGHTLSVIVVKAEAIRRTLGVEQVAAAEHAGDIETIGRRALTEVRKAATGYRSVSLHDELANARKALRADDIDFQVVGSSLPLDSKTDSLLGWVVREGVTNVLRHSEASFCRIRVTVNETGAQVEIVDNGAGALRASSGASANPVASTGLQGLRERVDDLGGDLTFGATDNGFRLFASIPERALPGRF